jgi:hypothetical protein
MTLLDLSPADFRRFQTVLIDRRPLGSQCCLSTGLVANGIRLTKRCNALSSRSDVTRGLPPDRNAVLASRQCLLHIIYIDYSKNNVPLKRCAHTSVTIMSNID